MKTLVLGAMPQEATPQTCLPAGIWCFAGREHLFPRWWKKDAFGPLLPNDPFPTKEAIVAANNAANAEAAKLLVPIAAELEKHHGVHRAPAFWEMALGPWLLLCLHVLHERQARLQALVREHGGTPLRVLLAPQEPLPAFTTSLDFMVRGVLDVGFTHILLSRMLEHMAPPAWQLEYGTATDAPTPHSAAQQLPTGLAEKLKRRIATRLRDLPFPLQKGFSLPMVLGLSFAVRQNCTPVNHSTPFARYGKGSVEWQFPLLPMVQALLPTAFTTLPLPPAPQCRGKLRGMTAAFSQDEAYRFSLAAWREGGGKLFSVQHGANYGNLASVGITAFEYAQHAFFSWGFTGHPPHPVHAIPLPSPALCRIKDAHKEKDGSLILVGSEMSTLAYRLKTRPYAHSLLEYREAKTDFIRALPEAPREKLTYRPYFAAPGGLEDGPFIQREFPDVPLCRGDLTQRMLGCRLLVLDHYGTTLHTAFAANVPTICFWHPAHWGMEPASEAALQALREAGILHNTAASAAAAVAGIWQNPAEWWQEQNVQAARTLWCNQFARYTPQRGGTLGLFSQWFTTLRSC